MKKMTTKMTAVDFFYNYRLLCDSIPICNGLPNDCPIWKYCQSIKTKKDCHHWLVKNSYLAEQIIAKWIQENPDSVDPYWNVFPENSETFDE